MSTTNVPLETTTGAPIETTTGAPIETTTGIPVPTPTERPLTEEEYRTYKSELSSKRNSSPYAWGIHIILCSAFFLASLWSGYNLLTMKQSNTYVGNVTTFHLWRNPMIIFSLISLAISLIITFLHLFDKKELISEAKEKEFSKRNDQESINNIKYIKTANKINFIVFSILIATVMFNIIIFIYKNKYWYKPNMEYIKTYLNTYLEMNKTGKTLFKIDTDSAKFNNTEMNTIIDILRKNNLIKPIL